MKKDELVKENKTFEKDNNVLRGQKQEMIDHIGELKIVQKKYIETLEQKATFMEDLVLHLTSHPITIQHKDGAVETFYKNAKSNNGPYHQPERFQP